MQEKTKENKKQIEQKLKYIGLKLEEIPKCLENTEKIRYRPLKTYEDNNYKIYKYVNVKDIEIYITPVDRLESVSDKMKKAKPLSFYMTSHDEENIEEYESFLNMINNLDMDKIKKLEEEQKKLNKNIPYEIKYSNNYIWQIYYSEAENKYFMLFSSNENNAECLFYLIKKKISAVKLKKKELIYVPISHMEYTNKILKKSEIADLENYLWLFTKEWPSIYEVYDEKENASLEIVGKTTIYEKVKSIYKISLEDKKEAENIFKLIKALFILQSNEEYEYDFKPYINEQGGLDFCYNMKKITYENLSEFIRQEVEVKQEKTEEIYQKNIVIAEKLEMLNETVKKQKEEFLVKERQITTFLECKKSFFGKVKYFFKKGTKIKNEEKIQIEAEEEAKVEIEQIERIEEKNLYTIEDLLNVCEVLKREEQQLKNAEMDKKALENKKENLERKIKNATLYINEIESHKKSIFDFWKFTNKDEVSMLTEAEKQENENANKIKRKFDYEEDIEGFGEKLDDKQKMTLSKNECDAMFAIRNDLTTFNLLNKEKLLKKDDTQIQKILKKLQKEYMDNIDEVTAKDFDIFGNVAQDKTKIKVLNNIKHREVEKDKYNILNVNPNTTLEEYKENIENYRKLLKEAYGKIVLPIDVSLYKLTDEELKENSFEIMDLNPKTEIKTEMLAYEKYDTIKLYRLNVKEKMPILAYTNIAYYDDLNRTLPLGMNVETKALIDLSEFDMKLISRKDFNINYIENEFANSIKTIELYEYDLEIKTK